MASNSKNLHDAFMSEEEIGEIRDELKAYKEQLDTLKNDLEVIIQMANPHLIGQARHYVQGNPSAKPELKEKCVKFLERHPSSIL
jgi:hypothetical protein